MFGLELEGSAAEMHLRRALQQSSRSPLRLLSALGSGDQAHVQVLKDLAVRKGFIKESEKEP